MVMPMGSEGLASFSVVNLSNWTMNARPMIEEKAISELKFSQLYCSQMDARLFVALGLVWVLFVALLAYRNHLTDEQWLDYSFRAMRFYVLIGGIALFYLFFMTFR